ELGRISIDPTRQASDLIDLGRRLYRLDKLTKIASEHYTLQMATGGGIADELEVHLAYRVGLARSLDLPGQPQGMMFNALAGVSA
ncbi:NEL-type E3 ubiquitin ligase domain-containing protein, partial [Pseudomonas sp. CCC2.2]